MFEPQVLAIMVVAIVAAVASGVAHDLEREDEMGEELLGQLR